MPASVPHGNFNFEVDLGGGPLLGFRAVVLPAAFAHVIEYREGGDAGPARTLPGRISYGALVLSRAITASRPRTWWSVRASTAFWVSRSAWSPSRVMWS